MNKKAGITATIIELVIVGVYIFGWITQFDTMRQLHVGLYDWTRSTITTVLGWF